MIPSDDYVRIKLPGALRKAIDEHCEAHHNMSRDEACETFVRMALLPFTVKGYTRMPCGAQEALKEKETQ